jgi:hypothetical protein
MLGCGFIFSDATGLVFHTQIQKKSCPAMNGAGMKEFVIDEISFSA